MGLVKNAFADAVSNSGYMLSGGALTYNEAGSSRTLYAAEINHSDLFTFAFLYSLIGSRSLLLSVVID